MTAPDSTNPPRVPAARHHFRELAHAEALRDAHPKPPNPRGDPERLTEWATAYRRLIADVAAELERVAPLLCPPCRGTGATFAWRHPGGVCPQCSGDGLSPFARGRSLTGLTTVAGLHDALIRPLRST